MLVWRWIAFWIRFAAGSSSSGRDRIGFCCWGDFGFVFVFRGSSGTDGVVVLRSILSGKDWNHVWGVGPIHFMLSLKIRFLLILTHMLKSSIS